VVCVGGGAVGGGWLGGGLCVGGWFGSNGWIPLKHSCCNEFIYTHTHTNKTTHTRPHPNRNPNSNRPGAEDVDVVEDVGLAEVEERPELLQRVLDGRPREEEAGLGRDLFELVEELPVAVLDPLALVHLGGGGRGGVGMVGKGKGALAGGDHPVHDRFRSSSIYSSTHLSTPETHTHSPPIPPIPPPPNTPTHTHAERQNNAPRASATGSA
jgi:hypothetical protein